MINKIIDEIRSEMLKPRLQVDIIKEQLKAITKLYDRVKTALITTIQKVTGNLIPSSEHYNSFLAYTQRDINLIKYTQDTLLSSLLIDWNSIEQSEPEINEKKLFSVDTSFITELPLGSVYNNAVLSVSSKLSMLPNLKASPDLKASLDTDLLNVYYGKAYGAWIEGNETGEDGIRSENNDGSLIVDNKDTFWEVEVTTVEAELEDTEYFTDILNIEPELTVTLKVIFKTPSSINYFTIIPNNFASDAYYKLIKIVGSTGTEQIDLGITETLITKETIFTFDTVELTSMYITLKQTREYYEKYTLGRYILGKNEKWIDVTGPQILSRAVGSGKDINIAITDEIENIGDWIGDVWLPNAKYKEKAVLDTTYGTDGYAVVSSLESRRKRIAIGITDIDVGFNNYENTSEIVTENIDIPDNILCVSVDIKEKLVESTKILYYVSFDDGLVWNRINPVGKEDIVGEDLRIVPKKYFINSDISQDRKKNSDTGESAYINTKNRLVRFRFVLKKEGEGIDTPKIISFIPIFEVKE